MTLLEAIQNLTALNEESTIYAAEPFSEHSEVVVSARLEREVEPKWAQDRDLTYFLEVCVASEVLEGWITDAEPTLQEKCARLIHYARNDA